MSLESFNPEDVVANDSLPLWIVDIRRAPAEEVLVEEVLNERRKVTRKLPKDFEAFSKA